MKNLGTQRSIKAQPGNLELNNRLNIIANWLKAQLKSFRAFSFGRKASGDNRALCTQELMVNLLIFLESITENDEAKLAICLKNLDLSISNVSDTLQLPLKYLFLEEDSDTLDPDCIDTKKRLNKRIAKFREDLQKEL